MGVGPGRAWWFILHITINICYITYIVREISIKWIKNKETFPVSIYTSELNVVDDDDNDDDDCDDTSLIQRKKKNKKKNIGAESKSNWINVYIKVVTRPDDI